MNTFYTDKCPIQSANNLAYRHVVKMIVEGCQLLSTAHHILGTSLDKASIYRKTHHNHPSAIWIRQSKEHYDWLWMHTKRMCEIYTTRTGRVHASEAKLDTLLCYPTGLARKPFTVPPACVDDDLKCIAKSSCTEKAYHVYLNRKYREWQTRDKPLQVLFTEGVPKWYDGGVG